MIKPVHFLTGEPCEFYHCVLESKSFLEKMTVLEHTVPFFLPIREIENDLHSSNAMVKSYIYLHHVYFNYLFSNFQFYGSFVILKLPIGAQGLQMYVLNREIVLYGF